MKTPAAKRGERSDAVRRVRVQYFAMLREQARCSEEVVATTAATPADLYEELRRRHGFSLGAAQVKVAVDDDFAAWDAPLTDGSRVVFVPPFAGG